jgi:imidazoleglycerol phosphate synthase glutamine amidotransferase subunit HisH
MYWVHHYQHRVSHLSYLKSGESFPTCVKCGERVRFEFAPEHSAATHISLDADFGGNSGHHQESKAG